MIPSITSDPACFLLHKETCIHDASEYFFLLIPSLPLLHALGPSAFLVIIFTFKHPTINSGGQSLTHSPLLASQPQMTSELSAGCIIHTWPSLHIPLHPSSPHGAQLRCSKSTQEPGKHIKTCISSDKILETVILQQALLAPRRLFSWFQLCLMREE